MKHVDRPTQIYVVGVTLLGVVGLTWPPATPLIDPWGFVLFFVLCGLVELTPIHLFEETTVSLAAAIALAGLLLFGPFYAAWINVAFGIVQYVTRVRPHGHPVYRTVVTVASVVLAARLAGVTHGTLTDLLPQSNTGWALLAMLGTGFVYFTINTAGISGAMALEKGTPVTNIWRRNYTWLVPNFLAMTILAWGVARVYTHLGLLDLLVLLIPLAMARYSFKLYTRRTEELRQRNRELKETNEHLTIMQEVSRSLLASLDPQETLDLAVDSLVDRMGFPAAFVVLKRDGRFNVARSRGTGYDFRAIRRHAVNEIWPRMSLGSEPHVASVETHPRLLQVCQNEETEFSLLYSLPLVANGQATGLLSVGGTEPWGPTQQKEFFIFMAHVSTALERAYAHEKARQDAILDPLTELYNHRYFQETIREQIEEANRRGGILSLLMLDIDGFKQVNDTYGHLVGDQVLRQVARVLHRTVRERDTSCRYGGDEMAVLLVNTDRAHAITIAQRIHQRIESHSFRVRHRRETLNLDISASIGVSTYPEIARSRKALIATADRACYHAKRLGGGVVAHRTSSEERSDLPTRMTVVK